MVRLSSYHLRNNSNIYSKKANYLLSGIWITKGFIATFLHYGMYHIPTQLVNFRSPAFVNLSCSSGSESFNAAA